MGRGLEKNERSSGKNNSFITPNCFRKRQISSSYFEIANGTPLHLGWFANKFAYCSLSPRNSLRSWPYWSCAAFRAWLDVSLYKWPYWGIIHTALKSSLVAFGPGIWTKPPSFWPSESVEWAPSSNESCSSDIAMVSTRNRETGRMLWDSWQRWVWESDLVYMYC